MAAVVAAEVAVFAHVVLATMIAGAKSVTDTAIKASSARDYVSAATVAMSAVAAVVMAVKAAALLAPGHQQCYVIYKTF